VPGDLVLLEELLDAARGRVKVMSVSPDCPNIIPVIERLREHEIAVFLTHTRASVKETMAAIDAGARHATHFYDVFPLPPETEPGVRPVGAVETVLADPRCSVDFICDGVHVDPMAVRLAVAAKGTRGVVAITDSNIGAGLDEGIYPTPWGYDVAVSQHDAVRVHDAAHPLHGLLSGSSLTMDRAVANLFQWLDLPAHDVWAMGTVNPAGVIGLPQKGVLQKGADADLVLWQEQGERFLAVQTWIRGECVFADEDRLEEKDKRHGKLVSL
jgi:N-acetylglucosamine-6-phosphate deacetylase